MPEPMEDELAGAFAAFRTDAMRRVRPAELPEIRAAARIWRRREVTSRTALGAIICVAVVAASFAVARPLGLTPAPIDPPPQTRTLWVSDLVGQPVDLPQWPDLLPAGSRPCPRDKIASAFQSDWNGAVVANIKSVASVDVNLDGRQDLVAVLSCQHPAVPNGVTVEQVVAFSGEPGGPVTVLGQVTTTSTDTRGVVAVMGAETEGSVTVRVQDHVGTASGVARVQDRTYAFDGTAFRQIAGPTTKFGPNPDLVNLVVTVDPVELRPSGDGATAGTLRIVLRSVGPGQITSVQVTILATVGLAIADPACTKAESYPGDDVDPFECQSGPLAPGDERVLTYPVSGPATVSVDSLTVIADAVSPRGWFAEAERDDNLVTIPVVMG